jgi:hydrogenase maturation protein HypF
MAAEGSIAQTGAYPFDWGAGDPISIPTAPIIRGVAADVGNGCSIGEISARFHRTLVDLFTDLCRHLRRQTGLNRVALSGGVFQNVILLEGLTAALEAARFEVFANRQVPSNDGGVSLGQAVAAAAMLGQAEAAGSNGDGLPPSDDNR